MRSSVASSFLLLRRISASHSCRGRDSSWVLRGSKGRGMDRDVERRETHSSSGQGSC